MVAADLRANDARLRDALVAGDEVALGEAFDAHAPTVYRLVLRLTGDPATAEDITQEVFVELWTRPERYRAELAPLGGWLCVLARRRTIDWQRRQATRQRSMSALAARVDERPGVEQAVLTGAVLRVVRTAVDELPQPFRQAIELAYYAGMSYRKVAQTLAIPEGTAKSRLRSGLRRIAERLAAEGITDRYPLD